MFGLVLVCAVTFMQAYAFWRVASLPVFQLGGRRIALLALALFMWGVFVAARFLSHARTDRFAVAIDSIGMHWMVAIFLVTVALLAVDLLTGFGAWFPQLRFHLRAAAVVFGIVLVVIAIVQGHRPPAIESYDVPIKGLPLPLEGKTIIALSDLHLGAGTSSEWISRRVDQVIQQRPDLIVFLGDVVEGHGKPSAQFARELSRLSAPLGVWGVAGNHELHGDERTNGEFQKSAGIQILESQSVRVGPGLVLAGVRDLAYHNSPAAVADELARTLPQSTSEPTILLSHAPVGIEGAARRGVSLMMSGHTHGGQIWPFSYLVASRYPIIDGAIQARAMTVIVCRGTGTWGPRMRLWKPAAMLRITLRKA